MRACRHGPGHGKRVVERADSRRALQGLRFQAEAQHFAAPCLLKRIGEPLDTLHRIDKAHDFEVGVERHFVRQILQIEPIHDLVGDQNTVDPCLACDRELESARGQGQPTRRLARSASQNLGAMDVLP